MMRRRYEVGWLGGLDRFRDEMKLLFIFMVIVCVGVRLLVLAIGDGAHAPPVGRRNQPEFEPYSPWGAPVHSSVMSGTSAYFPQRASVPPSTRPEPGTDIAIVSLAVLPDDVYGDGRARHSALHWQVLEWSIENKAQYSHVHQYPLFFYHNHLVDPERPIAWSKIKLLLHYLARHDWLFWIDNDAMFMDMSRPLEYFLASVDSSVDLVIGSDWNGLNTGVFFIRNSHWSRELLRKVWGSFDDEHDMRHHGKFNEQSGLQTILHEYDAREVDEHVHVVPMWWFNSLAPSTRVNSDALEGRERILYEHGDFVMHTAGLHVIEKVKAYEQNSLPNTGVNHSPRAQSLNWRLRAGDYGADSASSEYV